MSKRRWLVWAGRIGAGIFGAVVLGLVGFFLFLQTKPGLDFLARQVGQALSDEKIVVRLDRPTGSIVSSVAIGRISIADKNGVYAVIDDARLDWRPLALFRWTLDIESLTIGRFAMDRLPAAEPVLDSLPASGATPFSFAGLTSGIAIRVGKIAVEDALLAEPVLGQSQRLSATGSARLAANLSTAFIDLSVRRLDGGGDRADIRLDYAAKPVRFGARVHVEEPAGGLLARLAGLPGEEALFVDLSGDGPPDDWRGILKFVAGPGATATATLAVALREKSVGLLVDGNVRLDSVLPARLRPFAAPSVRLRVDADLIASEGVSVRRFAAESELLALEGAGRYGFAKGRLSGTMAIGSRVPHVAASLIPDLSIVGARIEGTFEGTLDAPRLDLSFRADGLAKAALKIGAVSGVIAVVPAVSEGFDVKGTLNASGVDADGAVPGGVIGSTLDLTVAGTAGWDASLRRMTLTAVSGPASAEISGQVDGNGVGGGTYSVRLERLEPLARSVGQTLKGNFRAGGMFRVDASAPSLHMTTEGALADLSGVSPGSAPLLGGRVPFSGTIDWHRIKESGHILRIAGLKIAPAAGRVSAEGELDIETGRLSARLEAAMPSLRPLSSLAGMALAGQATVTATVGGTLVAPTVRGQALVAGLRVDGAGIGSIGAGYAAQPQAGGAIAALRLGGTVGERQLDGTLTVRFQGDAISFSDVDVGVAGNRLKGALGLDSARGRIDGALMANLPEIGNLPGAKELGIAGTGEIRLAVDPADRRVIEMTATMRDISIGDRSASATTIAKAEARFRVRDPLGAATATGELDIENVRTAGLKGGRGTVKLSGGVEKVDWSVTASGEAIQPLTLAGNGTVGFANGGTLVSFEALGGRIADNAFKLQAPFTAMWQAGGGQRGGEHVGRWRIDPVDLSFAEGRLSLSGSSVDGKIDARARIDALPLRLVALVDPRFELDGVLGGRLDVSGPAPRPEISMTLSAGDIRPIDMKKQDFAGFDARLDLRQDGKDAQVTAKLTGPEETSATASLKTGPVVSLAPLSFAPQPDLPLAGEVTATGRLELIERLVGLGEDRLAGRLAAQATIGGTVGKPDIRGKAKLADGFYEGALTGTVLRNINAEAVFAGDSAQLVSLTADDGADGRLSGKGVVRFDGENKASESIRVDFNSFNALRHPLAEITVSGGLALSGLLASPGITGRLTAEKGNIRIPDRLPESVVELDVVEINGREVAAPSQDKSTEPSVTKSFPISLGLTLDFPGRTFVRGRGLDSEWKGNLQVSGTTADPLVKGKLEAVRGTFAFAGKTFVVKSGSVFFPTSAGLEPEISAVAETQLKDILARVEISGSISKPDIAISSEPTLPQEDVLSQILFGRTSGQLSALQAAQLAQTAATLSGKGGAGIMDKVRQALGVDVLNIDSGSDTGKGASLKAGKYLTEDIFLSVTQGNQAGSQRVGVEVQVLPNITVESDVSGAADSNIGINWKWDY